MTSTFEIAPAADFEVSGTYTVDPTHSRLGFQTRHAMVTTVRGHFDEFSGSVVIDEANPAASKAEVVAQIASIKSGQEQRDQHLVSPEFFDSATYPTMTFTSTGIEKTGDDEYKVTGDLTIKSVTKSVVLDVTFTGGARDPFGNSRIGFEGTTTISRKEWDLTWNVALEAGGVMVSDKVKIELDVSLIKSA